MSTLRKFRVLSLTDLENPTVEAAQDLERYARKLASAARELPIKQHPLVLELLSDLRIYCAERNLDRWSDGRYYLLNRGYELWRGHEISFTREELTELGLDTWDDVAIRTAYTDGIYPLEADCFHGNPGRHLAAYASLVERIAEALWARAGKQ